MTALQRTLSLCLWLVSLQASSGGAARARPGLERQHSVVVLEDQDQAADLFKNTHLKHG